ncbi:peptidoglycan-binding domain-containing protein [Promicromonospora sp. AC04]|uniref:peptidoglycan-binding domain-containing protein n=1 Tax=Promicromonospora sp. AC04 TaxID=2135723 RepID=UPI001E3F7288|nr:peptidoglycan-binding domain-containing protein [Promicromonospora sp. AC04]
MENRPTKKLLVAWLFAVAMAFGMVAVAVPSASAAAAPTAYEKCNTTREVYSNPGYYRIPANGSDITCWLAYDRSSSNPAVTSLQGHIKICYIDTGRISWSGGFALDGYFGDDTLTALKRVQNYHGVGADGEYGPATRDAMFLRWSQNPSNGGRTGCSNTHTF